MKRAKPLSRKSSATAAPAQPQTSHGEQASPAVTESASTPVIKLSEEQINLVVFRLVRSWGFWWKMLLGLVVCIGIAYFSISRSLYQSAYEAVTAMHTTALMVLSNKVSLGIASMEQRASNRLANVDSSLSNLNSRANQRLAQSDFLLAQLESNVNARISASYQEITNLVTKQLVARIAHEFENERIVKTVSDVAASRANQIMTNEIAPILAKFVAELKTSRSNAESNIAKVQAVADFGLLVLRAENDEGQAFDELVALRDSPSEPYSTIASRVVGEIATKLSSEAFARNYSVNVWSETTNNYENATMADYEKRYTQVGPIERVFLIHEVLRHEEFPKYLRIQFMFKAAHVETSIKCRNQICYSLNAFAKTNYNLLGLPLHEKWWAENEEGYRKDYQKELQTKAKQQ